jgi:general nucleoside transport system permease protein
MQKSIKVNATNRWIHAIIRYEWVFTILSSLLAIILGLSVVGILINMQGVSPLKAYSAIWQGAFSNPFAIATSLNRATPLILAGLGTALAFKSGVWTIGAEGQIYFGALTATLVAINVTGLPAVVHLPLVLLAGFLGAGIWGCIVGILKAKYKVNEIISSLMMNYIAVLFVNWLTRGIIRNPNSIFEETKPILPTATLPILWIGTPLHAGIIVALLAAIILFVILWRSPFGYQIRTVGMSLKTGRYAGMNVISIQVLATFIGAGLAGLAGACEILGAQFVLRENFLVNFGYDAIVVAVLGQFNPIGVVITSILFGGLRAGAGTMQRLVGVPSSLIYAIQGIVVLFVVSIAILRSFLINISKQGAEIE